MNWLRISLFDHKLNRCARFKPDDFWRDYDDRPWGGNIDSDYCYESQAHEGEKEKFCQIKCNRDGTCTETVRQKKCACPEDGSESDNPESDVESNCATVKYKVWNAYLKQSIISK